ncbi:MAG: SDR family oxidoreductase, partial [Pseudomonadota bacterium]
MIIGINAPHPMGRVQMPDPSPPLRSLVTGGAGALGAAIIHALRSRGDRVVCLDRVRPARLDIEFVELDVSCRASVRDAMETAVDLLGGVDVLVNAAGIMRTSRFCDLDEATFREVLDVNLLGAFHVAQEAVRHMMRSGGRVLLITSIHG